MTAERKRGRVLQLPPRADDAEAAPNRPEPLQVSIRDAARLLAFSERTIRELIYRGELVGIGRGKLRRIEMASIRAYLERNRNRAA